MFYALSSVVILFVLKKIFVLLIQRRRMLMCLLVLESLVLSILLIVLFSGWNLMISLIVLCMAVCEASLGLALLVRMMRQFGSDKIGVLTNNKW